MGSPNQIPCSNLCSNKDSNGFGGIGSPESTNMSKPLEASGDNDETESSQRSDGKLVIQSRHQPPVPDYSTVNPIQLSTSVPSVPIVSLPEKKRAEPRSAFLQALNLSTGGHQV